MPPSINKPNPIVAPLPDAVSHVYVRQHNTKGLDAPYMGPFKVTNQPTRSTIQIKSGLDAKGFDRLELRHVSDVKVANLREDAAIAELELLRGSTSSRLIRA